MGVVPKRNEMGLRQNVKSSDQNQREKSYQNQEAVRMKLSPPNAKGNCRWPRIMHRSRL
jgi:hypothetical protein